MTSRKRPCSLLFITETFKLCFFFPIDNLSAQVLKVDNNKVRYIPTYTG